MPFSEGNKSQRSTVSYGTKLAEFEEFFVSLDWFKGKFTGNHGFYHQIDRAFRLKFSHHPIL